MASPLMQRFVSVGKDNPMAAAPADMGTTAEQPAARRPRATRVARTPIRETPAVDMGRHRLRPLAEYKDMSDDSTDPLHIPPELIPEGFTLQWVADKVYGACDPQRRAVFERKGWVSVHQTEFDGRFDGRWMASGKPGEIETGGLVLMARPKVFTQQAHLDNWVGAKQRMMTREEQMRRGDLSDKITLDTTHKSALAFNYVKRELERLPIGRISEAEPSIEQQAEAALMQFGGPSNRPVAKNPWE